MTPVFSFYPAGEEKFTHFKMIFSELNFQEMSAMIILISAVMSTMMAYPAAGERGEGCAGQLQLLGVNGVKSSFCACWGSFSKPGGNYVTSGNLIKEE